MHALHVHYMSLHADDYGINALSRHKQPGDLQVRNKSGLDLWRFDTIQARTFSLVHSGCGVQGVSLYILLIKVTLVIDAIKFSWNYYCNNFLYRALSTN